MSRDSILLGLSWTIFFYPTLRRTPTLTWIKATAHKRGTLPESDPACPGRDEPFLQLLQKEKKAGHPHASVPRQ